MTARIGVRFGLLLLVAAFATPTFGESNRTNKGQTARPAANKTDPKGKKKLSPEKQQILDQLPEGNPQERKAIRKHLQTLQDRERIAKAVAERQEKAMQKDAERRFHQSQKNGVGNRTLQDKSTNRVRR
jgi:hypothetical protein